MLGLSLLLCLQVAHCCHCKQALSAPTAVVVRDGEEQELPVRELVPGDLILLKAGDVIPADCEVGACLAGLCCSR